MTMDPQAQASGRQDATGGDFVTFTIAGQLFGVPVLAVQDVLRPQAITRIPMAPPEILGSLNLRGRIVTAIEMRSRLDAQPRDNGIEAMAIGIEAKGESFGLLVDTVGEVLKLADFELEPNPINLDRKLAVLSHGVYRLDNQLLVVLDIDEVLRLRGKAAAA